MRQSKVREWNSHNNNNRKKLFMFDEFRNGMVSIEERNEKNHSQMGERTVSKMPYLGQPIRSCNGIWWSRDGARSWLARRLLKSKWQRFIPMGMRRIVLLLHNDDDGGDGDLCDGMTTMTGIRRYVWFPTKISSILFFNFLLSALLVDYKCSLRTIGDLCESAFASLLSVPAKRFTDCCYSRAGRALLTNAKLFTRRTKLNWCSKPNMNGVIITVNGCAITQTVVSVVVLTAIGDDRIGNADGVGIGIAAAPSVCVHQIGAVLVHFPRFEWISCEIDFMFWFCDVLFAFGRRAMRGELDVRAATFVYALCFAWGFV